MKTGIALPVAALTLAIAPRAGAVETAADVETDHIDAADDGGPRSAAILVRPLAMAVGAVGAEADVALGDNAAVGAEASRRASASATVVRAAVGLAWYPQRFAFRGFVVRPVVRWASAEGDGGSVRVLGLGATVGYEWTWPFGATVRVGGGASYARAIGGDGAAPVSLDGVWPELDATVGWVL